MSVPLHNYIYVYIYIYICTNNIISKKVTQEFWGNLVLIPYQLLLVHLLENFCPGRILNTKFGKNEGTKNCTNLKMKSRSKSVFSQ